MHGLRHVYASTLVENGVDLYQVQKLLTHKSAKMLYACGVGRGVIPFQTIKKGVKFST
jgi:hypothetical protein